MLIELIMSEVVGFWSLLVSYAGSVSVQLIKHYEIYKQTIHDTYITARPKCELKHYTNLLVYSERFCRGS